MRTSHQYLTSGAFEKGLQQIPHSIARMLKEEQTFYLRIIQPRDMVLDIGTGTGRTAIYLSNHARRIMTIDNCQEIVAKNKDILANHKNITSIVADAANTPFKDRTFDNSVFGMSTLGTFDYDTQLRLLQEAGRITKGRLLGTVYGQNAAQHQKEWYETTGVKVTKIDKDFVYVDELGFRSQRFSQEGLGLLFSRVTSNYSIVPIAEIGLAYEVNFHGYT